MSVTRSEKAEWATSQIKHMMQTWFTALRDNRVLRGGPGTRDIFKKAFLDKFFPKELRETKVDKFINRYQGGLTVVDYYFKFTKVV